MQKHQAVAPKTGTCDNIKKANKTAKSEDGKNLIAFVLPIFLMFDAPAINQEHQFLS